MNDFSNRRLSPGLQNVAWIVCTVGLLVTSPRALGTLPISDEDLSSVGMNRYWTASLPIPEGELVASISFVEDSLYATTTDGLIFSLRADAGLIRWVEQVSSPNVPILQPTHIWTPDGKGPVSIVSGENLTVIDRYNGLVLQEVDLSSYEVTGNIVGALRSFFFCTRDQLAYSYRLDRDGAFRKRWEVHTYGTSLTPPVLFGDKQVLLTNNKGLIAACSAVDKTLSWHFKASDGIEGTPAVNDSGVYVASKDRSLYKLDGRSGRLLWRVRFPSTLVQGPAVTANSAYQYSSRDGLTAIDVASGKRLWNEKEATEFVAESGGKAVVAVGDSRLSLYDIVSGKPGGEIPLLAPSIFAVNTANDAVFICSLDGTLTCVRPNGVPYLRYAQGKEAADNLNVPPQDAQPKGDTSDTEASSTPDARSSDFFRSRKDRN
ncbi:MAG: PQQ-binding-like beta-propeller repeat protein [Phycisphaerae bacterium]